MINTSELKTENGASNPNMEILVIWQSLPRICKCERFCHFNSKSDSEPLAGLVELAIAKRDPGVKSALELCVPFNPSRSPFSDQTLAGIAP